jgi:hypothetical protein
MAFPRLGGWSLIVASVLFWLSWLPWLLMPEPGTVDASLILAAIARQRGGVLLSAILQALCAIAVVPGAPAAVGVRSRMARAGAALLLVGALGNAADAVYHQLAHEMTAPDVDRAAMPPVMTRMQTQQIWLLAPVLVAFFPGALALAAGLGNAGLAPRRLWLVHLAALAVGLAGMATALTTGLSPRAFSLTALAWVSFGLTWSGQALRRAGDTRRAPGW